MLEAKMHTAFGGLDNRLHAQGRHCFEPPGQDGYNCLLFAAIDQLCHLGFACDMDADRLRSLVREFLTEWRTLVLDNDWRRRSDSCLDELMTLQDAGPDYLEFLSNAYACGNHVLLLGILGVFSKLTRMRLTSEVRG